MSTENKGMKIPFIFAGSPSPAENFSEFSISLDRHLIQNPELH